ncbi:MAG: ribosome small subunit-dependent GTPase A [Oscillospiraceae bacterium]|nr:ribosome small subunit-dependent GTPase A [Oscillospiraceae bacterium]
MEEVQGRIVKALSGFYYVAAGEVLLECRARGKFRKTGESPLVGDWVTVLRESPKKGSVHSILPRKNSFVRPPVANLDLLVILASRSIPVTEPFLIDRMTAIALRQGVEPVICVNKADLASPEPLADVYRAAGFSVVCTSAETGEGIETLRSLIAGKTVAFTGNSGVGKSAILRRLCPGLEIQTGEVSEKLGRGRHTTRHVELYPIGGDTWVADTPGFASFDLELMDPIPKEALEDCFPEFRPFLGRCRFLDCSHRKEPDCAVLAAVADGEIPASRHRSYLRLYEAALQLKPWETK